MLKQQVNLYRYLIKAPKFQLKQSTVILSYAAFFILLFIDYAHSLWLHRKQELHLQQLNKQVTLRKQELSNIMAKYPIFNEKDLASSVLKLKEQFNTRMKVLALLSPGAKFSSYLTAFAKVIPTGVWLSEINISNFEQNISLTGYSIQPLSVQIYLDLLSKETEFAGLSFALQELTQTVVNKNKSYAYISFRATTKPASLR